LDGGDWHDLLYRLSARRSRRAAGDDVTVPGLLHAAFVRSPHAHASIRGVSKAAALALPGVHAALTLDDLSPVLAKRPNLVRQEVQLRGQTMILAFDGVSAWTLNPFNGSSGVDVLNWSAPPRARSVVVRRSAQRLQGEGQQARDRRSETLGATKVPHPRSRRRPVRSNTSISTRRLTSKRSS
jgi:hypothetical protein